MIRAQLSADADEAQAAGKALAKSRRAEADTIRREISEFVEDMKVDPKFDLSSAQRSVEYLMERAASLELSATYWDSTPRAEFRSAVDSSGVEPSSYLNDGRFEHVAVSTLVIFGVVFALFLLREIDAGRQNRRNARSLSPALTTPVGVHVAESPE